MLRCINSLSNGDTTCNTDSCAACAPLLCSYATDFLGQMKVPTLLPASLPLFAAHTAAPCFLWRAFSQTPTPCCTAGR